MTISAKFFNSLELSRLLYYLLHNINMSVKINYKPSTKSLSHNILISEGVLGKAEY